VPVKARHDTPQLGLLLETQLAIVFERVYYSSLRGCSDSGCKQPHNQRCKNQPNPPQIHFERFGRGQAGRVEGDESEVIFLCDELVEGQRKAHRLQYHAHTRVGHGVFKSLGQFSIRFECMGDNALRPAPGLDGDVGVGGEVVIPIRLGALGAENIIAAFEFVEFDGRAARLAAFATDGGHHHKNPPGEEAQPQPVKKNGRFVQPFHQA